TYPCRYCTMKSCRKNIGKKRQIFDFGHGLVTIRKLKQVEIRIGNHYILCLPAYPASHIHITIGSSCPSRVDVEANSSLSYFTVTAPPTSNVKRHRNQIAFFDKFNIP